MTPGIQYKVEWQAKSGDKNSSLHNFKCAAEQLRGHLEDWGYAVTITEVKLKKGNA